MPILNWIFKAIVLYPQPLWVNPGNPQEHLHLVLSTLQRDLKPRNVVFSRGGRAKLTDFGMGRIGAGWEKDGWEMLGRLKWNWVPIHIALLFEVSELI